MYSRRGDRCYCKIICIQPITEMSEAFKENSHATNGPPTTRPADQGADVERITILEQNNNKLEEKMKFLIEVTETIYIR